MMHPSRPAGLVVALVSALVCLSGASGAQPRKEEAADHGLSGAVTVVDRVARTVGVQEADGTLTTFEVTDATTLMKGDRPIGLADLAKGDHVVVDWDDRGGRNVATYMEIVEDPPAPPPAASGAPPDSPGGP